MVRQELTLTSCDQLYCSEKAQAQKQFNSKTRLIHQPLPCLKYFALTICKNPKWKLVCLRKEKMQVFSMKWSALYLVHCWEPEKYWLHILSVVDGFPAGPYNGPDALYLVERERHEKHEKHEEHLSLYFINIPYCGGGWIKAVCIISYKYIWTTNR